MAKGIVKGIGGSSTPVKTLITVEYGSTQVTGTSGYNGATPVGSTIVGQITDSQTGEVIDFEQVYGAEVGLVDGAKVSYETVTIKGVKIANCVKLLERGVIESILTSNDGGTLKDRSTDTIIPFSQLYCTESGFVAPSQGVKGSVVSFERIIDPLTGTYIAVCLVKIK